MVLEEIYKLKVIAKKLGINYYRLRRVVLGGSGSRISPPERNALKELIRNEAEKCIKEIDEKL